MITRVMRVRGARVRRRDDGLARGVQPVHPRRPDEAGLTPVSHGGRQGPIGRASIVRRWREHRKRLVRRRSPRIQLATGRRAERDTGGFEVALETDRHHGGIRRGRLQQGRRPWRQRGRLVVVLVQRRLISLRRRVTRGHARAHAGGPRQRRLTFLSMH